MGVSSEPAGLSVGLSQSRESGLDPVPHVLSTTCRRPQLTSATPWPLPPWCTRPEGLAAGSVEGPSQVAAAGGVW